MTTRPIRFFPSARLAIALIATSALGLPAAAQESAGEPRADFSAALSALSPMEQAYLQHNATLSNPFFEGRGPGLRGNELAAEYCEFYFRKTGLTPLFDTETTDESGVTARTARSTYRQAFSASTRTVVVTEAMSLTPPGGAPAALAAGTDFCITAQSGSGIAEGPLVFVGYSIERGPEGYDSYSGPDGKDLPGADLHGKIAVMLRFEPKNEKGKSKWVREGSARAWSGEASLAPKLRHAVRRGAAGVILVNPPGADDPRINSLEPVTGGMRGPLGRRFDVPVAMMTIPQAARLVAAAGKDLERLTREADQRGGITPLDGPAVRIEAQLRAEPVRTTNVAGLLAGRGDLAGEYIVIGGHYDHVGYGEVGSRDPNGPGKLHAGADDNASGTSGVLLAAQIMSERYKAMPETASARSIVFIAFSGEELGLLGSRHFVRNCPIPASSTYIMLNMDMIGRLRDDPGLEVDGVGSAEGLKDLVAPVLGSLGVKITYQPGGSGPSDHASFYAADIPVLAFFTGFHREYHMPGDVFSLINTPGAVRVVGVVTDLATQFATRAEPLTFTRASGPSSSRDTGADSSGGPSRGTIRVQFGIRPASYDEDQPGIGIADVTEGGSAAEAGMKAGDRLLRWNGDEITDVRAWMGKLAAAKPGDVVTVVVKRGEEELTLPVTLKARDTGDR